MAEKVSGTTIPLEKTANGSAHSSQMNGKSNHNSYNETGEQWVYLFSEGSAEMRDLLGGKGANLAEMTRIGLSVPPGFTITTRACNTYLECNESFPAGMWEQVLHALAELERTTGKKFGGVDHPLLVSCRSGAKFSMPGMMDTVLNIGLNDETSLGMIALTGDERFVYDSYRRLISMYGSVVMGVDEELFAVALAERRIQRNVTEDSQLGAADLKSLVDEFKHIVLRETGRDFPSDPIEQLRLATEAVFKSWNGKRAFDYRNAAGIAHDLGTAVNIVTMVFGNMGDDSGTGVVTTRNVSTGEPEIDGDYLTNAQGEDVVAGTHATSPISALKSEMPAIYEEFQGICRKLEQHYREVQDVEFTIERGRLWILQTRNAKRTAQAAVRIAVELAGEGLITRAEAVRRVRPEDVDFFLHPQFDPAEKREAIQRGDRIATGLNVSPGAAQGELAFDADTAERWAKQEGRQVIMVRPETKPDDVHGMLAANGLLTSRGGRTSHAALVARQFGKPAVVGIAEMDVDVTNRQLTIDGRVFKEGEYVSLDGTLGEVFAGQIATVIPDFDDPYLLELLGWADEISRLGVWANADYPHDAERARKYGARGIGLCRTEHMFFESNRLSHVQRMILAATDEERDDALATLLPFQRSDFEGLFRAMNDLPVTIRLIDPPLHEFLPSHDDLLRTTIELDACQHGFRQEAAALVETVERRRRMLHAVESLPSNNVGNGEMIGVGEVRKAIAELEHRQEMIAREIEMIESTLQQQRTMLEAVEALRETNPMLGLRGVRLGIHFPNLVRMQVRAIFEAACICAKDGIEVHPKVMIPLTAHNNELKIEQGFLEVEANAVMQEQGITIGYQFGTMIEIPRAALTADQIAEYAQFFSFGTNDLTQTVYGMSRDDAESSFLMEYLEKGILLENPFATIDEAGVGKLMNIGVTLGRQQRPDLNVGICGEHGGDPKSIDFCHRINLDYVSCSPFRVPIARLAAAHAAIDNG
jgi:pyruvate,orthophosphate dikinase